MQSKVVNKKQLNLYQVEKERVYLTEELKAAKVFLTSILPAENNEKSQLGKSFVFAVVNCYWQKKFSNTEGYPLPTPDFSLPTLSSSSIEKAQEFGELAATLDLIEASYFIGNIYTLTIPDEIRAANGVFFTPPSLTARLLHLCEKAQVDWNTAKILDPACGGGAFLAPVALRILSSLRETEPKKLIKHIEEHLKGFELDTFSAWLSQVFVDVAVSKYSISAGVRLKRIVEVLETLSYDVVEKFDLIIGNPPYGKIKLEGNLRKKFSDSLYGHANLYGLFVHKAFQLLDSQGVLAYVTPTGFLGGEYFKKLRSFIRKNGVPIEVDFVSARKGTFDDVLQETMLLTIRQGISSTEAGVLVNEIVTKSHKQSETIEIGNFCLPKDEARPWIFPRNKKGRGIIHTLNTFTSYLKDWGFEVTTGPLVWNRHKGQLKNTPENNCYPLIWAEAISQEGNFKWKADKKNHALYCKIEGAKQDWLKTKVKCLLMQRTTAKEQGRRLNTALLNEELIEEYGGVVIENHINIIKPINKSGNISLQLLHLFLNSKAADNAFRCISGSVSVSAYELETMPLPAVEKMIELDALLKKGASDSYMEFVFLKLYDVNA